MCRSENSEPDKDFIYCLGILASVEVESLSHLLNYA